MMSVQGMAQQFVYNGPTEIANTIPFSNSSSNFRQSVYNPTDFPTAPSGNITAIYLKTSTTATPNISNMTVKMGTTTMNTFPDGTFIQGLQTVYSGSYNTPADANSFIKIELQTPFSYDHTQNFIVELSQSGYTTGFQIMQGSINLNSRTIFGNANNPSGNVQHRLATMGFDMDGAMSVREISELNSTVLYPNPTTDVLNITKVSDEAEYTIHNPVGQLVSKGIVSDRKVDVMNLVPGTYFITISENGERLLNTKFIKK